MFREFEGKEVKITYRDGKAVKVYHGKFVDGDQFIQVTFRDGTRMLINKSEIIKIIERGDENGV
jgi:hypothetical protein